jgi:hypothetical protein
MNSPPLQRAFGADEIARPKTNTTLHAYGVDDDAGPHSPLLFTAMAISKRRYLANSGERRRTSTVAANTASTELSFEMYRHCGSDAETNLDIAIGVQPAEYGSISALSDPVK